MSTCKCLYIKALLHALQFPSAERISYSTCSVHPLENELVVKEVLPEAVKLGYKLEVAIPGWHRRGLPGYLHEGSVEAPGAEALVGCCSLTPG